MKKAVGLGLSFWLDAILPHLLTKEEPKMAIPSVSLGGSSPSTKKGNYLYLIPSTEGDNKEEQRNILGCYLKFFGRKV
jgi:hypothetical protein